MQQRTITFIGAGNIVKAMLTGLLSPRVTNTTSTTINNLKPYPASLITLCSPTPDRRDLLCQQYGIRSSSDNIGSAQQAEVIILAVKPQLMAEVCQQLRKQVDCSQKLVISVAAGISCRRFSELLGDNIKLVRIMPNVGAALRLGTTGLFAPPVTYQPDRDFVTEFTQYFGENLWLTEEKMLNPFIAVSGSSPAYFFYFIDAIRQAIFDMGFDDKTAQLLAADCLRHAYRHPPWNTVKLEANIEPDNTDNNLQIDLTALPEYGQLLSIIAEAMQAAVKRAEEMENLF